MFELRQCFLLFLTATIWGSGFVGQKLGVSHLSPFAFSFLRTFIGALCLIPVIYMLQTINKKTGKPQRKTNKRYLILGSISCGFFLIMSESFQQFGLVTTDVNKASFITSLYMIFVPIIGILFGHKIGVKIVFSVIFSCVGLYLFCMKVGFYLQIGDFLVLLCALGFAGHILVISYFITHVDGVLLSCGQFFCASFMGCILMLCTEIPTIDQLKAAAPALLYVGIMSNGIAYTLQIVGQRGLNPTIASLIMSLESVMGAFFGVLFLNEIITQKELFGAMLMFIAVIITQISFKKIHLKFSKSND